MRKIFIQKLREKRSSTLTHHQLSISDCNGFWTDYSHKNLEKWSNVSLNCSAFIIHLFMTLAAGSGWCAASQKRLRKDSRKCFIFLNCKCPDPTQNLQINNKCVDHVWTQSSPEITLISVALLWTPWATVNHTTRPFILANAFTSSCPFLTTDSCTFKSSPLTYINALWTLKIMHSSVLFFSFDRFIWILYIYFDISI